MLEAGNSHLVFEGRLVALPEPRYPRQKYTLYALEAAENQRHVHVAGGVVARSAEQRHRRGKGAPFRRADMVEPYETGPALVHAAEEAAVAGHLVQYRRQVARQGGQVPVHHFPREASTVLEHRGYVCALSSDTARRRVIFTS